MPAKKAMEKFRVKPLTEQVALMKEKATSAVAITDPNLEFELMMKLFLEHEAIGYAVKYLGEHAKSMLITKPKRLWLLEAIAVLIENGVDGRA